MVMTRTTFMERIRRMSKKELQSHLDDLRARLLRLRRIPQMENKNTKEIHDIRKNIARILTVLGEKR